MRSRYAAFALGLGAYLYDTLAADHPDRAAPREVAIRELSRVRECQKFMRLAVLDSSNADADAEATSGTGEVLFFAGIFERGRDCSFAELSEFVREDGAWRYASGITIPRAELPTDPTTLDRASFLALAHLATR
jgi:SEC-C motif-containing protein